MWKHGDLVELYSTIKKTYKNKKQKNIYIELTSLTDDSVQCLYSIFYDFKFYFGKNSIESTKASPKGDFVTFRLREEAEVKQEEMELFITADGYNKFRDTKTKVSTNNFVNTKTFFLMMCMLEISKL